MKIKTSELTGVSLDWAVASCEGYTKLRKNPHRFDYAMLMDPPQADFAPVGLCSLAYSTDWALGGPIIEREKIATEWSELWNCWLARDLRHAGFSFTGPTPLIAAMRCYVASKLGETVEIPDELGG